MGKAALLMFVSLFFVLSTVTVEPASARTAKVAAKKSVALNTQRQKAGKRHIAAVTRSKITKKVAAHGRRRATYQRVAFGAAALPPVLSVGEMAGLNLTHDPLDLKSSAALVLDQDSGQILLEKNAQVALPIASLTKLMTSVVVVEANQDMNEVLSVTEEDIDYEKHSSSRLRIGSQLTRADMLHIALMSSENRAASALGRHYPGGLPAFVEAMNAKAHALGMSETRYVDSTGLSHLNVASALDLSKLVMAAYQYPIIRQFSTDTRYWVEPGGRPLQYATSNHLVGDQGWQIGLQKTGYINEAGHCLVMQTTIDGRQVIMVFLDSRGKYSRQADADRVRKWLVESHPTNLTRRQLADGQS